MAQQWFAGERTVADKLSTYAGEPVIREANVGDFTAETQVDTITVPVVDGRRYKIVWQGTLLGTTGGDVLRTFLKEDTSAGTQLQVGTVEAVAGRGLPLRMERFWDATATANKTFVVTASRVAGTGTVRAIGASNNPSNFYVENA